HRLAPRDAYGRAGRRLPANQVDVAAQILRRKIVDGNLIASALRRDHEFKRLAPVAQLSRACSSTHAPEIDAGSQVCGVEFRCDQLVALYHLSFCNEERRGGDLYAILRGRAHHGALPAKSNVGSAVRADEDSFDIARA